MHEKTLQWLRFAEANLELVIALDEDTQSEGDDTDRRREYLACARYAIHAVEATRESSLRVKLDELSSEVARLKASLDSKREENDRIRESHSMGVKSQTEMFRALQEIAALPSYRLVEAPTIAKDIVDPKRSAK